MALRGGPLRSSASAVGVPGWRTEDFLRFETDFLEEGVVPGVGGELEVTQRGAGANLSVDVAAGRALISVTTTLLSPNETSNMWLYSDAVINIPLATADATNPRIDRIVAKFDVSVDPNTVASNIVSIERVTGTPAGSPSAPAEPSNAITLALVSVPAGDTTITDNQITDSRPFVTLDADVLADIQRAATAITKTRAAFNDFTEKTIATGAITVDQVLHTVDTESDAASDDLATITAAVGSGEMIHLKAENTARTVVIKHGTGNILLADGDDFSLDDTEKSITLIRKGSNWHELARGRGAAAATGSRLLGSITAASSNVGATSTAEAAVTPTWTGTNSVSANLLAAGSVLRIAVGGQCRLDSDAIKFRVKLGGTTIGFFRAETAMNASRQFSVEMEITTRSIGATGKFIASGLAIFGTTTTRSEASISADNSTNPMSEITLDTTAPLAITFSIEFGASDSDHFLNIQSGSLSIEDIV